MLYCVHEKCSLIILKNHVKNMKEKNEQLLNEAVDFAIANESSMDKNIGRALKSGYFNDPWPYNDIIGPTRSRETASGLIINNNEIVKTWGDIDRVDMTFSISKSYLSLCFGVAVRDGLIKDAHGPISNLVKDDLFLSAQNYKITWSQLLQQTSEWEGTLWGKPDSVDHNRVLFGTDALKSVKGEKRKLQAPGEFWEYNDVRVNVLAYALLKVFKEPLPLILKHNIMDPIEASDTWIWHGYNNSFVEIDSKRFHSVAGGAHWGGGLWISSSDHAKVGQLMLNKGKWCNKEILPSDWVSECLDPCKIAPFYGYLWWLNGENSVMFPNSSASSFFAFGVGTQFIYVDPETTTVIVARWIKEEAAAEFVGRVLEVFS